MSEIPEKINGALTKASEKYVENISLRASVAMIPYIGGSLDIIFSAKGNEIIFRRINFFLKFLEESVSKLDEDKIDKEFLESEDWFDLIYRTFDEVKKTRIIEKQKIFAKILANSTLNIEDTEDIEIYIRIIGELSGVDLIVLDLIYKKRNFINSNDYKTYATAWEELTLESGFEKEKVKLSLYKLFSLGLITERYGAILDYKGGAYKTTSLLEKVIEFIK